jgi:hypothetical protein
MAVAVHRSSEMPQEEGLAGVLTLNDVTVKGKEPPDPQKYYARLLRRLSFHTATMKEIQNG